MFGITVAKARLGCQQHRIVDLPEKLFDKFVNWFVMPDDPRDSPPDFRNAIEQKAIDGTPRTETVQAIP